MKVTLYESNPNGKSSCQISAKYFRQNKSWRYSWLGQKTCTLLCLIVGGSNKQGVDVPVENHKMGGFIIRDIGVISVFP